jgi:hypothetical protein
MLFPQSFISDSFEKVDFNINVHGDYKFYENYEFFWNFWNFEILNFKIFIFFIWKFWIFYWKFWNFMKFYDDRNFEIFWKFWNFEKNFGFLDSDDNARGSRKTITVVCSISDVQLKIPRKLFKLPVNSSAVVNSLENYGPVNSLSV